MNFANVPADTRCVIFSKINNLKEIKNIVRAYPKYAKQLYSCIIEIKEEDDEIIPAKIVLKMINLREIDVKILVDSPEELELLSNRTLNFLRRNLVKIIKVSII